MKNIIAISVLAAVMTSSSMATMTPDFFKINGFETKSVISDKPVQMAYNMFSTTIGAKPVGDCDARVNAADCGE
jgi:hypothetical protein